MKTLNTNRSCLYKNEYFLIKLEKFDKNSKLSTRELSKVLNIEYSYLCKILKICKIKPYKIKYFGNLKTNIYKVDDIIKSINKRHRRILVPSINFSAKLELILNYLEMDHSNENSSNSDIE